MKSSVKTAGPAALLFSFRFGDKRGDFPSDAGPSGVKGFLEVVLGLQSDQEISGHAEAKLEAYRDSRTDALALADDVAELGRATQA